MKPARRRELAGQLTLLSGATMLSLVLLEAALRIISPPSLFSPLVPLRPHNRLTLHVKNLPGVSSVGRNTTNRWGMRGDEPPANWEKHYTIITVGGSTTQCFYLDDHKTWPYLLQQRLREKHPDVWVGNGGLDGHTTRGHIVFMEEVIKKIRPKAVLLLVGINDLGFSLHAHDEAIARANTVERTGWRYRLFASSRLLQILNTWKQILIDRATVVKMSGHGGLAVQPMTTPERLPQNLQSLLPALNDYRANIHRIIRDGQSMNVRVIFMTQPLLFQDTPFWRRVTPQVYWMRPTKVNASCATYWRLLDIYNKTLIQTCASEGAECLDLASLIPHSPLYFYDHVHFNERGAALVAKEAATFLERGDAMERAMASQTE